MAVKIIFYRLNHEVAEHGPAAHAAMAAVFDVHPWGEGYPWNRTALQCSSNRFNLGIKLVRFGN
jgi:hypothetical protein